MKNLAARTLRNRLKEPGIVVAPGIFEMISARIADRMGFEALYLGGYGVAASAFGLPDAGLLTYTNMIDRVRQTVERTETPIIADADTGYGGLLNIRQTVRGYEEAGVAAIQLEDQEMPKRCGHTLGRRVVSVEEMVTRLQVASDARKDDATIIIARTDARTEHGIEAAIERALEYREAGADILFVESPESKDELRQIAASFGAVALINMVASDSRSPVLSASELEDIGLRIVIYSAIPMMVCAGALKETYETIQRNGDIAEIALPRMSAEDLHNLVGFPEVWEFERRYSAI